MTRIGTTVVLVSLSAIVLAQSPNDFARGADIRIEGRGTIFRALLPDDVYDTIARADLADIRVLNAAGEAVPHTIREVPRPASAEIDWRALPSFPMTETARGPATKTQVRVGADGAVLEVVSDVPGAMVASYLVDASALDAPLARLALTWEAAPDVTFLERLTVTASDDLDAWRTVVASAAVAQLRRGELTLTQNEIELPAGAPRAKYLRISWPRELAAVTLTAVRARPQPAIAEQEIRWKTLTADRVEAGTATYDARARVPVEYIDVEFADSTDAAFVTVRSGPAQSAEPAFRHSALFYSLDDAGTVLRSPFARIATTTDRYWTVSTDRAEGWRSGRAPRLKIGWHAHELVFLAQGTAPYTLVYGSGRVGTADAPVRVLLDRLNEQERANQVGTAAIGPPRTLGGAEALQAPTPWRQIALWAALVAAVGALAFMAVRLFRDASNAT